MRSEDSVSNESSNTLATGHNVACSEPSDIAVENFGQMNINDMEDDSTSQQNVVQQADDGLISEEGFNRAMEVLDINAQKLSESDRKTEDSANVQNVSVNCDGDVNIPSLASYYICVIEEPSVSAGDDDHVRNLLREYERSERVNVASLMEEEYGYLSSFCSCFSSSSEARYQNFIDCRKSSIFTQCKLLYHSFDRATRIVDSKIL